VWMGNHYMLGFALAQDFYRLKLRADSTV